ncbi:MAG: SCP2 sterol-binding domain-containing protein [Lachnospiraceae bacterium]|nr:SCP2 sterol-binding domain-containing protein [Lachnospiraceae bacterium]
MTYEELVENVRKATKCAKVSRAVGHVAFQFNVEGEAEGAFYLEIADGRVNVEPYEYFDRDVIIVTTAEVIMQMAEGKLQPRAAYTNGQLRLYGDVEQIKVLPLGGCC